jgi:hypothetical protein
MTTVNLTALAEARENMTLPADVIRDDWYVVDGDGYRHLQCGDVETATGIVATHNAIPVLIEVARAAMALRDSHGALDTVEREMMHVGIVSVDQLLGVDTVRDAKVRVNEAGAALLAALAKVSK